MIVEITTSFIESLQTCEGGYTNRAFSILGVPIPPQHGWKRGIIGNLISVDPEDFERARYTDKQFREMVRQLDEAGIVHNFDAGKQRLTVKVRNTPNHRPRRLNGKKDRIARRRDAWANQAESTGRFNPAPTVPR